MNRLSNEFQPAVAQVEVREVYMGFFGFLTQLCAIVGGILTVSSMLDKLIFSLLTKYKDSSSKLG